MIVKNFEELSKSDARKFALELVDVGLGAVETGRVIREIVKLDENYLRIGNEAYPIKDIERLFVVGVGKCSLAAGETLENILGDLVSGGVVIDVREGKLNKIHAISGDHPFPSEKNVSATEEIIKLLTGASERDFVIFIVSGGGSTLLCHPEDMTCLDEAEILKFLYGAGVGIRKINTVRKHLSTARGGYLAKYAYPAKSAALIFSDVPGDDLEFIASGPTIKDTTTIKDAERIVNDSGLKNRIGKINLVETPKEDKYFANVKNILAVSNKIALTAMEEHAKAKGFNVEIVTTTFEGEAKDLAVEITDKLHSSKERTVQLYGGESTVTIRHVGKGGRNLELALSALRKIEDNELILPIASDGKDNTDFAGAISDIITKGNAERLRLDEEKHLEDNRSYDFFSETGDYVKTGDTGRNIADLVLAIKT